MAHVIKLRPGEAVPENEPHALVHASMQPPVHGAPSELHKFGQTFFALDTEDDVVLIVGRASVWADENGIANVYVRCPSVEGA